jgi:hypothetical protein
MRTLKQTDRSGRPFDVMEDGRFLANYFNFANTEPRMRSFVEPVKQVAVQLAAMTNEFSRARAAFDAGVRKSAEEITRGRAEQDEKLRQFNALLEPHTWHLYLVGWNGEGGKAAPVFVDMPTLGTQADLMFRLIQIARAGLINRLRICAGCGIWFFARKPWGKFHSDACKKATNRSTPEFKEANKNFQRKYYREKLSPYQRHYKRGLSPADVRELSRPKERKRAKKR